MPLARMLPLVAILLLGEAVLDAGPAIVAEREGGMGLGSALIAASVTRLAGIVAGSILGGLVVDRRSVGAALLSGALLYYVGMLTTGIAPMGSLATVVAGMGIAGVGLGFLLASAFSLAAALERRRDRVVAVVLLLAVPIAARSALGIAFASGPLAFLVAGAAVVALAILAVRLPGASSGAPRDAAPVLARSAGTTGLAAVALAGGALLTVAGADPSRLSASLLAGMIGGAGLESLDAARAGMAALGMVLVLVGAAILLSAADRVVRIAAPSLLLVALSGSGVVSSLTQAVTAGRVPDGTAALIGATGALAGLAGLGVGGAFALAPRHRWLPAVAGSAMLALAGALGWVALLGPRPEPGAVAPIFLVGIAAFAMGIAAAPLRLALTDVPASERGLAAGAGVAAVTIGTAIGGLLGAGEAVALVGGAPRGLAIGLAAFVIAGAAATALGVTMGRRHGPEPPGPDGDPLSRSAG